MCILMRRVLFCSVPARLACCKPHRVAFRGGGRSQWQVVHGTMALFPVQRAASWPFVSPRTITSSATWSNNSKVQFTSSEIDISAEIRNILDREPRVIIPIEMDLSGWIQNVELPCIMKCPHGAVSGVASIAQVHTVHHQDQGPASQQLVFTDSVAA